MAGYECEYYYYYITTLLLLHQRSYVTCSACAADLIRVILTVKFAITFHITIDTISVETLELT